MMLILALQPHRIDVGEAETKVDDLDAVPEFVAAGMSLCRVPAIEKPALAVASRRTARQR